MTKTIELDTVVEQDETLEGVITKLTAGTSVQAKVVTEHGPASGHPLVQYTGAEDELREVAKRYGGDTEELLFG